MPNYTLRHPVLQGIMLLALVLLAPKLLAYEVDVGSHVVHYNVIKTNFLSPEVARAYNISRSRSRALVNVVVMERQDDEVHPVSASLTGQAINLNRQTRQVRFREVREGNAIYQLAEIPVRGGEVLDFHIRVSVAGRNDPIDLRFRQTFYHD